MKRSAESSAAPLTGRESNEHAGTLWSYFAVAGLMETGGGYLMWLRERWAWRIGALGALVLVGYGIVPTLQPANCGRVYAAYGGVFISAGVTVIMYAPPGGRAHKAQPNPAAKV